VMRSLEVVAARPGGKVGEALAATVVEKLGGLVRHVDSPMKPDPWLYITNLSLRLRCALVYPAPRRGLLELGLLV
jgi:hypothetical protein